MEALALVLAGMAATNGGTDTFVKAMAGLFQSTRQLAQRMVGAYVGFLRESGGSPQELSLAQFLCSLADFYLERFRYLGLLEKAPFTAPRRAEIDALLKLNPKLERGKELRAMAVALDLFEYARTNYLGTLRVFEQLAAGAPATDFPDPADSQPGPSSPEALACREKLAAPKFVNYKTKPFVPAPVTMAEVLAEPTLPVELAARVLHCAYQTLLNKLSKNSPSRDFYASALVDRGDGEGPLFYTQALLALIQPKTTKLPGLPKLDEKRRGSGRLPDLPEL